MDNVSDNGKCWLAFGKYLVLGVAAGLVAFATWQIMRGADTLSIPAFTLGGIIILLGTLLIFSTFMNAIGLSDKTMALGLPEGSVRAIVALALVAMFAILTAQTLLPAQRVVMGEQNQEQIDLYLSKHKGAIVIGQEIVKQAVQPSPAVAEQKDAAGNVTVKTQLEVKAAPATFKVTYSFPSSFDDFAKQMLTLVGTLMTAVVSFYFGTAANRPASDPAKGPPDLARVDGPNKTTMGHLTVTANGTNLNNIRRARLSRLGSAGQPAVELETTDITSNQGQAVCIFTPNKAFEDGGEWDLTLIDDITRTTTLKKAVVLALQQAPQVKPTGITPANPPPAPNKDTPISFTITGMGLSGVTKVDAMPSASGSPVSAQNIQKSDTELKFSLVLSEGTWRFRVITASAVTLDVPGDVTIPKPTQ